MEFIKNKNYSMLRGSSFLFFIIAWLICGLVNAAEIATNSPSNPLSGPLSQDGLTESVLNDSPVEKGLPQTVVSKPTTLPDDEDNIRLLELSVGRYKFDELVVVYQYEDMLFVPLGTLSQLIDLAIKTDPSSGIAKGFIFDEKKTFYLDINRGEVTLSGKMIRFDNKRTAAKIFDDIYVDSDLLSKWLSLRIEIDLYASRLNIKSDKPLPFQLRKERESRMKGVQHRLIPRDRGYPRHTEPFEDWEYPNVNLTARLGAYKNNIDKTGSTFSYATYATADLFKMESAWYLAGNQDKYFDDSRVTFGRKDIDSELLGPLRAREYAFGHVVEPRIDLINRPGPIQPGLYFSNYPLTRQQQYDSHSFSGDLPPGWEVELYRNNSLLNYQPAGVNGRYQFDDVPLLFGHNHFRLVFYGPQGQIREETQTFELGESLTRPGDHYYRVLVSKDEEFGNRTLMQYDHGINKYLSATAGYAKLPIDSSLLVTETEKEHQYITAGLKGFQKSLFYKINYTNDSQSGSAVDWGIQSRLGPVILNASEIYFDDYISEVFAETLTPIKHRRSIKLDTAIPTQIISRIPVSLEYQRDTYEGGLWNSLLINRVSAQKYGYAITNTLTLNSVTTQDDVLSGAIQVSRRAKKYNLRTNLGYRLKPDSELDSVALTVDGFRLWGFNATAGMSKVISADTELFTFGLNQQLNGYTLGMDTRSSTDGTFSFNITFTMGIAREPRAGIWVTQARPLANQGSISTLVYLDENGDGKKNPEEQTLSGVSVNVNGGVLPNKTDEKGIAFNSGITPYREIDVDLALDSLEDPLWLPARKGVRIDLRPGHVTQLDFPIITTGEVDGTAYVSFGGVEREASGVIIELIDEGGTVIQSTKTAYDGFYVLEKIPVGVYKLSVSEKQIEELGLQAVEPIIIEITTEKQIINGRNFVITKKQ